MTWHQKKKTFVCWYQVRKIAKRNFSLCKIAPLVTPPDLAPIIKKSRDFFRLRSTSGRFSSSIFDYTALNAAHCDAGPGSEDKRNFLLRILLQKYFHCFIISRQVNNFINSEKYSRGRRGAPAKGVGCESVARVQIPPSPPS